MPSKQVRKMDVQTDANPETKGGRSAAGQDPVKRQQILEGAKRCFLRVGFEAASMNEITVEAGVSKGTIYVYFANKEELFSALIDQERGAMLGTAQHELDHASSTAEALRGFGRSIATQLTCEEVVRAQRMVLAVVDRMPQLAARFFASEPFSGISPLKAFLDRQVAAGELAIDDTELAAQQFSDLSMTGLFKRRLFGNMSNPPSTAEIAKRVDAAVDMFLCRYAAKPPEDGAH